MFIFFLKVLSLCSIFLCASSIGLRFAADEKTKLHRLEGLLALITHIKRKIEYYSEALSEIYSDFTCDSLDSCGFLPALRVAASSDSTDSDGKTAFCKVLEETRTILPMSEELYSTVYEFGLSLGSCVAEDQIRRCSFTMECIEAECSNIRGELPKKAKLHTTLGFSVGLMLVILLI